ncbi:hypothetical protein LTR36_006004 [Oleoguttula mirabilis]|uniref:Centrosomin N-terminal motif 1 domain-containing protein n=1 Tax=Oleoguttula mirabilis TaxID=1507867 RepID=A0AAV9JCZ8_9PEZI|nr:hypothetical protein LTR36_006004 [Oleoguttula mirabilis]
MDTGAGPYRYAPQEVLPASQYLQERLLERRARNTRPKRSRQSDFGPRRAHDDDIFLEEAEQSRHTAARMYGSSPITASSTHGSQAGASGYSKRQSLSVKDMDGQMDRLNKQNFALKLELDHRRENSSKLQEQLDGMRAQVERSEQLEEEHTELLKINLQLVEELEKRDKAVEEAMDIICDLEEKVVDMEERRSHTRPSTANADSGYAGTETHEQAPQSSPPQINQAPRPSRVSVRQPPLAASAASQKLHTMVGGQTPAKLRREPSILSQEKPSTHALRSVYLESAQNLNPVQSFNSLLSRRDGRVEEDAFSEEVPNSPRLSVLSESSFPSLYSPKKQSSPERYAWEAREEDASPDSAHSHFRQASINRVSRWISNGEDAEETPSKSNRISSPLSGRTERGMPPPPLPRHSDTANFQSLDDALSTASIAAPRPSQELLQPETYSNPYLPKADKQRAMQIQQPMPTSLGGPIFGEPLLPPTPDSASTRMLRASRSSIAGEPTLLDTTPTAVKGFDALEPDMRTAPKQMRSSVELNGAYYSNVQYRNGAFGRRQDEDEDEVDHESSSDGESVDTPSESIKDLGLDYDGFPDGNSIIMGTPSRFLKRNKAPAAGPLFFNGHDVSPPDTARSPPRRRQSSSEATASPRKPSLGRAETSPTFLGSLGRIVTSGSKSTVDTAMVSPRSFNSGSSSNRTVIQTEADRIHSLSPDLSRAQTRVSRPIASPALTLGQRTQQLFRRMSNSHSERTEPRGEREKSPLPTLTSTPSSAYINVAPRAPRRPSTGESKQTPTGDGAQRAPSSGEGRRPSMQGRTQTEPASARQAESAAVERRNPFKRTGSVKKVETSPPADFAVEGEGSASRGGIPGRKGSIREAVSGSRRPWR